MQTETTWTAMRLRLESLRQEYDLLWQEYAAESDPERRRHLFQLGRACLREFETVIQEWRNETIERS
jgi:hypothetical protein